MANEATIRASLQIKKDSLDYRSNPTTFNATVNTTKGATPGGITATVAGVVIDLSALSTPGFCRIHNLDDSNFVTFGVYDGVSFFPLLELLPGEFQVIRLSRYVNLEFVGTGTNADTNQFMVRADTADCEVNVEAFDR